jgi:hypothetical protein
VMPIIAVAQTLYSLAAVILFTLERPFALFYFAIPGLAIAFMRWDGLIDLQQTLILAASWLLSLIVYTFAIAIRFGHNAKAVKVPLFTVTEVLGSIPFVLQGAFSALLLAFNTLMSLYGVQVGEFPPSSYAIIPLVLTMGFAELELSRYRGNMNHILYVTSDLEQFRVAAQRVFADSLGRYLVVLVAFLIISGFAGNIIKGSINQDLFFVLIEGLLLGAGFFASFILIAHNRVGDVVLSTALAILVRLWLLLIPADVVGIVNLAQSELIASAVFAIATLLIARSIVGKLGTLY